MADTTPQTPSSTPEISRMFNLGPSVEGTPATSQAPANIPTYDEPNLPIEVLEEEQMSQEATVRPQLVKSDDALQAMQSHNELPQEETMLEQIDVTEPSGSPAARITKAVKKLAPYLVVFAIGLGLYFFYFNTFSFTSIFKGGSNQIVDKDKTAQAATLLCQSDGYNKWISQFFFDVSVPEIIDPATDVSGNGLTNCQKYLLNLNPKMYDTLGDDVGDGQKILSGKNPWTGAELTEEQKKIADTYFDREAISNRIAAAQAQRENTAFAPFVSNNSPYFQPGVSNIDNGDAETRNLASTEAIRGGAVAGATLENSAPAPSTSTNNQIRTNTVRQAPVTGTSAIPSTNSLGIDTNIPGVVNIPSIGSTVPLIWSKDVKSFEADLKKGVIHYAGTPLPGSMGTSYISGHSSGYFFDKSQYKQAFARLGEVKNGSTFTVTVTLKGGQKAVLHYRVDGRAEYAADDQRQFLQSSDSVVALSTCWPLNTTARRLVLFGNLTKVDK